MNKTETIRLARKAYAVVVSVAGRHAESVKAAALAAEKRHRRGDFRKYHPSAASAEACAELFVAKFVAGHLTDAARMPSLADILHLRPDAVLAAAIVAEYGKRLREAFDAAEIKLSDVAKLDYCTAVGPVVESLTV